MAEKIQIQIDAETRQAIASLAKLQSATDDVTKATNKLTLAQSAWKTLNTDISKLGGSFGQFSRNVATGVAAGVAGFAALAYKATELAAAVEQQEMAITRLGPAYEAVRAATAGVVTAQDALKAQQTLVQSGLRVSTEQLATITRAAREYSRATGTEMTQSLEQLTDALRTGSGEGLGRFGVSLQQGVTGARAFGSALEQLTAQQQNTAVSSRTLREDLDKLPEGLMAVGRSILSVLEGPADALTRWLTGLVGASTSLRGVLSEIASAGDTIRQRERQEATDRTAMERLDAREALTRRAGIAGVRLTQARTQGLSAERLRRLTTEIDRISGTTGLTGGAAVVMGARRGGLLGAVQGLERQGQVEQVVDQLLAEAEAERRAAQRPAQGPAVRRASAARATRATTPTADTGLQSAKEAFYTAVREGAAMGVGSVSIDGPDQGESARQYLERLAVDQRALNLAARQAEDERKADVARSIAIEEMRREDVDLQQRRIRRDRETRRMARAESLGGRALSALGIETDAEGRIPAFDMLQQGADMLGQSLSTLQSGFANLFNTLASGSMSAGEAFQQFAAKTLSSLGEMAVNKGVFYTFEGIASLFTNPVAAPTYFAAGAGLIALGVGLGAAGAAVAPSAAPGGSSAPAAARSASGASPRGAGEGAGNVTIVLSSLVPPGPRELQGLVNAQRQAGRYGIDRDRMVPRQVRA